MLRIRTRNCLPPARPRTGRAGVHAHIHQRGITHERRWERERGRERERELVVEKTTQSSRYRSPLERAQTPELTKFDRKQLCSLFVYLVGREWMAPVSNYVPEASRARFSAQCLLSSQAFTSSWIFFSSVCETIKTLLKINLELMQKAFWPKYFSSIFPTNLRFMVSITAKYFERFLEGF